MPGGSPILTRRHETDKFFVVLPAAFRHTLISVEFLHRLFPFLDQVWSLLEVATQA